MTTLQRLVLLLAAAAFAAVLYAAFRGYFSPALLIDFANGVLC